MRATSAKADPILAHLNRAREQIAHGDLKGAARTLNEARAKAPQDARVFMLAGLMAEKAGNTDGALKNLRHAVELAPDWNPGQLELALLLARSNRCAEAVALAERLALREPKNPLVLAGVVDIAHRCGHGALAVRELRRGLTLVPGDVTLRRLLARDLGEQGAHDEALALWDALLAEHPADAENLTGRVQACIAAGRPQDAQANSATLLAQAPANPVYRFYAQVSAGQTPARQPAELIRALFDSMAAIYDQHMVRNLHYQLPKRVAAQILARRTERPLNVLDLGCGTGLLGVCLGKLDGFVIGVDLAPKMLEQAARHKLYERFHTVDLHDALRATPNALYQVIAALDVFVYAGELGVAVADAYRVLAHAGELVFSCEAASESGPAMLLQPSGRYAHKRSHVLAQCQAAGFERVEVEELPLRQENHKPVAGFVVTAYKPV